MTLEDQGKLQQRIFAQRLPLFTALVALVFGLLVLRLYYLQIVRGRHFSRLAEENRISLIRVRAPRGIVFDRHGNVLVTNRPSFSVSLDLDAVRDLDATVGAVAAALGLDRDELARKVRAVEPYRRFEPLRVKDDVDRQEVAALEALRYEHPGVLVEVEPRRSYPHGTLASHVARVRGPDQRRASSRRAPTSGTAWATTSARWASRRSSTRNSRDATASSRWRSTPSGAASRCSRAFRRSPATR